MSLIAVFHPLDNVDTTEVNELKYAVAFMDSNGDLLKLEYVAPGASATAPSTATITKIGYSINATTPWSVPYTAVADDVVTILQYDKIGNPSYTVTVVNGTGGGSTAYNAVTTVIAGTAPEGQTFHHWEMQDQTVSYASTFSFTVVKDTTVTAYYATSAPADQPRVFLTNDLALRSGYKTFIGQFYLPSGYTLVEWGIVTTAAATAMTDIGTASVIRNKSTKYTAATKEFVLSIVNANSASYRGYLICKDGSNALVTVYSETAYNILNGGFETGTLFGWNAYQIWKNESGMYAYANDRISSNPNYPSTDDSTSYPANNSGTYYLSSRFGSESSSRSQERMGHLRSSDFILGGSGWISFKLGGIGSIDSIAYVSVRKTSDNTEVARFGNPNYNNNTVATEQYGSPITSSRAFLFQYYFDLSTVADLGTSLYIVLTDASSYEWSVITTDAITTYLPTAPTTSSSTLAVNIVPAISGISTATNQILSGDNFVNGLTNWTNTTSGLFTYMERDGKGAGAWSTGAGLGVLRSSAFTVDGTLKYVRCDFAGGKSYDKQIFFSIKEVGTNIEVIRVVRRDNNTSNTTDWNNLLMDLSGLSTSKKYYIELSDNISTDSIGVRNIRLVDYYTPDGDRGVHISGIVTNYIYQKPSF